MSTVKVGLFLEHWISFSLVSFVMLLTFRSRCLGKSFALQLLHDLRTGHATTAEKLRGTKVWVPITGWAGGECGRGSPLPLWGSG